MVGSERRPYTLSFRSQTDEARRGEAGSHLARRDSGGSAGRFPAAIAEERARLGAVVEQALLTGTGFAKRMRARRARKEATRSTTELHCPMARLNTSNRSVNLCSPRAGNLSSLLLHRSM